MNLSPRQLRIFVLLADTLSFRKTAEILHVTQPTLSKLLKEMEDGMGVVLFERSTRMVRLSREGQDILETARRTSSLYDKGLAELDQRLRERTHRIAVAALPTLAASLIPQLVCQLKQTYPQVHVEVFDPVANEALDLLSQRRVDIAVTAMGDDESRDLAYEELFTEPLVLFHSHKTMINITHWSAESLSQLPIISMPVGTSVRELTERVFHNECQPFTPVYSLRDLNTIARFVQADCGVALLPESALDQGSHHGVLKTRLHGAVSRSVGMFVRREYQPSRLVFEALAQLRVLGRQKQRGMSTIDRSRHRGLARPDRAHSDAARMHKQSQQLRFELSEASDRAVKARLGDERAPDRRRAKNHIP